MRITPAQCRAARALLALSTEKLAVKADVSRKTIEAFESGERKLRRNNMKAVSEALMAEGVVFLASPDGEYHQGVALRPASEDTETKKPEDAPIAKEPDADAQAMIEFWNDHPGEWDVLPDEAKVTLLERMNVDDDLFGRAAALPAPELRIC